MKKILFLSFAYPYGHFGPSDLCTSRIMEALVQTGKYDVHNISCACGKDGRANYKIIEKVRLHFLPFPEKADDYSKFSTKLFFNLAKPIYPLFHLWRDLKYYMFCRRIIKGENFDLVIAQRNPEESMIVGVLLKKFSKINNLLIIFWDKIYGTLPKTTDISNDFVFQRTKKMESWIAQYADKLVSLYPLKEFHEKYGELPNAIGKRIYLGIPGIMRPKSPENGINDNRIKRDKINIIFSGTIFYVSDVSYMIDLFNQMGSATDINIILFCRGINRREQITLINKFRGTIYFSDWIPLDELQNLFHQADAFISFPGNVTSIRSKNFEYVVYGKILLMLYNDDSDVNVKTFSRYPACFPIDLRRLPEEYCAELEKSFYKYKNKTIPYEEVEKWFPYDTTAAYVKMISDLLEG